MSLTLEPLRTSILTNLEAEQLMRRHRRHHMFI
jgi:hypothetical protein